jgi:hypothetical protein
MPNNFSVGQLENKLNAIEEIEEIKSIEDLNVSLTLVEQTLLIFKQNLSESFIEIGILPNKEGVLVDWQQEDEERHIRKVGMCIRAFDLMGALLGDKARLFLEEVPEFTYELAAIEKIANELFNEVKSFYSIIMSYEESLYQLDACSLFYNENVAPMIEEQAMSESHDPYNEQTSINIDQIHADLLKACQLTFLQTFASEIEAPSKFPPNDYSEGPPPLSPATQKIMETFTKQDIRKSELLTIHFPDRPVINADLLHL